MKPIPRFIPSEADIDQAFGLGLRYLSDQQPVHDLWCELQQMIAAAAHAAPRSHAAPLLLGTRERAALAINPFWSLTMRAIAPIV